MTQKCHILASYKDLFVSVMFLKANNNYKLHTKLPKQTCLRVHTKPSTWITALLTECKKRDQTSCRRETNAPKKRVSLGIDLHSCLYNCELPSTFARFCFDEQWNEGKNHTREVQNSHGWSVWNWLLHNRDIMVWLVCQECISGSTCEFCLCCRHLHSGKG